MDLGLLQMAFMLMPISQMGLPNMAISACYAGPLLSKISFDTLLYKSLFH